ncbi:hypothetical protein ACQ86G_19610 [Roseateles chitinivorans]|uniref:hypothetical protein n=1 Tax=Roseateles chitinivorans TaxID=2917965 RepID=UPI003D672667
MPGAMKRAGRLTARAVAGVVFLAGPVLAIAAPPPGASMAGSWGVDGGKRAMFSLEALQQGQAVCGRVETISGDKVDSAWFVGTVEADGARISFQPNFTGEDERGRATLTVLGKGWHWQVTEPPATVNHIWDFADLKRNAWGSGRMKLVETWCRSKWPGILAGRLEEVDLGN